MKKIKTFALCTIAIFSFSILEKATAQTSILNPYSSADMELLKGFDEQSLLNELKEKGVPESEMSGIIRYNKGNFLIAKKGLKPKMTHLGGPPMIGPCVNSGFEDTTFTNWSGATGFVPGTVWTAGFISNGLNALENDPLSRHTIITNTTGFDINAVNIITGLPEIPLTAPGGNGVSVRLGNDNIGAETEKLDYVIAVTTLNTSFTYKYAVVLQNPTANPHPLNNQPRFDIRLLDQFGVQINGPCGVYGVTSSDASTDSTYHLFNPPAGAIYTEGGYYKKWTTVTVDLTPYLGTNVTIEFQTSDCTQSGHFGYAYIDATCSQLQATTAFCPNDSVLMLVAPAGFVSYQWYDGNGILIPGPVGTNDTLWIPNPTLGQVFTVSMFSAAGCGTSLTVTLSTSTMSIAHGVLNGTCMGLYNGLAYATTTGANPPLTYVWHDITTGGNVVGANNDSIINMPPGVYYVSITSAGGCSAMDTMTIANPIDPIDTIFHATTFICPQDSIVILTAPAGHPSYSWVDQAGVPISAALGGNSATITIHSPFSVGQIYYCALECPHWFADSLIQNILQGTETHTDVTCYGFSNGFGNVSTTGPAPGPYTYTWTNTANSTIVNNGATYNNAPAGNYSVLVSTYGGCAFTIPVTINQPNNPDDSVHLTTTFCMEDKNIVLRLPSGLGNYFWYFGTDTSAAPISFNDTLLVQFPVVGSVYTILIVPGGFSCPYTLTYNLQYSPPPNLPNYIVTSNVFTPDNDGVNDKFDVTLDPSTSRTTIVNNTSITTANEFTYVKDFHIEIYNRWGKKVFTSDDVHAQWDGKINGNAADEGVYYWMCSFTSLCTPTGEPHESTGFVQVVRKGGL